MSYLYMRFSDFCELFIRGVRSYEAYLFVCGKHLTYVQPPAGSNFSFALLLIRVPLFYAPLFITCTAVALNDAFRRLPSRISISSKEGSVI